MLFRSGGLLSQLVVGKDLQEACRAGNYAAPPANRIVHDAELVFFVGCETGDQTTHTWRIPAIDTPCVQIDLDPAEIGRSYPNTVGVMGDPKATLAKQPHQPSLPARHFTKLMLAGKKRFRCPFNLRPLAVTMYRRLSST